MSLDPSVVALKAEAGARLSMTSAIFGFGEVVQPWQDKAQFYAGIGYRRTW